MAEPEWAPALRSAVEVSEGGFVTLERLREICGDPPGARSGLGAGKFRDQVIALFGERHVHVGQQGRAKVNGICNLTERASPRPKRRKSFHPQENANGKASETLENKQILQP